MMELEPRVQALEQEIEILKNEIQAILLDIQEQVLSNSYLDLRSSDGHVQESTPRPQPKAEAPSRPASSFRTVSLKDDSGSDDDDDEPVPHVPAVKAKAAKPAPDAKMMAEMKDWATQKIETLGVQKTSELIHMYASQGRFSRQMHDSLLDFIATQNDRQQDAPTQPSRPTGFAAQLPQNSQPRSRALKPSEVSIPGAVYVPASAPKPVKNVPPAPAPKSKVQPPKPQPATTSQVSVQAAQPTGDASQNIVLRLIAGVQNAGAGVRWGKK